MLLPLLVPLLPLMPPLPPQHHLCCCHCQTWLCPEPVVDCYLLSAVVCNGIANATSASASTINAAWQPSPSGWEVPAVDWGSGRNGQVLLGREINSLNAIRVPAGTKNPAL